MKHLTLVMLVLTISVNYAQDGEKSASIEKRIEIEANDGYTDEKVISLGELGFIWAARGNFFKDGQKTFKYDFYNDNLEKVKTLEFSMDKSYFVEGPILRDNKLYLCASSLKLGRYRIQIIDAHSKESQVIEGDLPGKMYIDEFRVTGNILYASLKNKLDESMMVLNLKDNSKTIVPLTIDGFKSKDVILKQIKLSEKTGDICVLLEVFSKRLRFPIYAIKVGKDGVSDEAIKLTNDDKITLKGVSVSAVNDDKIIISGSYTEKDYSASSGIFYGSYSNGVLQDIDYTKFIDLQDFISFLPEHEQAKIKKWKDKADSKEKDFVVRYNVTEHDIIPVKDGSIFIGECFDDINNVRTMEFVGNQYTHATIIKFSDEGEIQWDKTVEMHSSRLTKFEMKYIHLNEEKLDSGIIDLVFLNGAKVQSMSFDFDGNVISDKQSTPFSQLYEGDSEKEWGLAHYNLEYWYDNYYIGYGAQKITNEKQTKGINTRKVMFINKIRF